jgi:L-fuconolactonase
MSRDTAEGGVMIDFPIVDTHVHVWDPFLFRYPWLESIPSLNWAYLVDDFREACEPVVVEKAVFVQAEVEPSQYRDEVAWVTDAAAQEGLIEGIVAWAPLEKGAAVDPELAWLAENPLVKGVRRIIQFEDDIEFCLKPDFVRGVQLLPRHGFSFDICINHLQMANTLKLVEQCPDVTFVLDHIGKPDIKGRLVEPWKRELKALSEFPNVSCKISGLVTEADMMQWTRRDLKPYIDHVIDCFGFDRTMYGGDWPVAYQATEYPEWVATLDWAVTGCSRDELLKLFRENAIAFYRL